MAGTHQPTVVLQIHLLVHCVVPRQLQMRQYSTPFLSTDAEGSMHCVCSTSCAKMVAKVWSTFTPVKSVAPRQTPHYLLALDAVEHKWCQDDWKSVNIHQVRCNELQTPLWWDDALSASVWCSAVTTLTGDLLLVTRLFRIRVKWDNNMELTMRSILGWSFDGSCGRAVKPNES